MINNKLLEEDRQGEEERRKWEMMRRWRQQVFILACAPPPQSLGSVQLLLKKKSTAVDTELRSGGAVCTLALQEDDHWFHPVQVCSVPGPQSQWIVSVNAW